MQNSVFLQGQNQPGVEKRDFKKQQNSQDNIAADQHLLTQSHTLDPLGLFRPNKPLKRVYLQPPTSQKHVPTNMTALDEFLEKRKSPCYIISFQFQKIRLKFKNSIF